MSERPLRYQGSVFHEPSKKLCRFFLEAKLLHPLARARCIGATDTCPLVGNPYVSVAQCRLKTSTLEESRE